MASTTAGDIMCEYKSDRFTFENFIYTPFEINFEPDNVVDFAKNNYNFMYGVVSLYIISVVVGQYAMKHRQPAACVSNSNVLFLWNMFLAAFSLYGTTRVVPYVFLNAIDNMDNNFDIYNMFVSIACKNTYAVKNGPASLWVCLFVFSKVIELGDTVILVLLKRRISVLHFYHHATVLPWAWYELANESAPSATFAAMNLAVHSIMYSYFAISCSEYGRERFPSYGTIPKVITFFQCLQMFCGIVLLIFAYYHKNAINNYSPSSITPSSSCNVTNYSIGISTFIYVTYFILFLNFANNKYGIYSRLKTHFSNKRIMDLKYSCSDNKNVKQTIKWPWRNENLSLQEQYTLATKLVTMLAYLFTEKEGMKIYGAYKQVEKLKSLSSGAMVEVFESRKNLNLKGKDLKKYNARKNASTLNLNDAMEIYINVMNTVADRADGDIVKKKHENRKSKEKNGRKHINNDNNYVGEEKNCSNCSSMYNATIIGYGKALPRRVVTNMDVEKEGNFPAGSVEKSRCGVKTRHHADLLNGENQIQLACKAIKNAVKKAHLNLFNDIDCIIHCGGVPHQAIPDDACLIQNELGLGNTGIPSFSVHATCLSFLVAMDIAGSFIQQGRYRTIVLTACNAGRTYCVNKTDTHTAPLFGDGAAAVILSSKSFASNLPNKNDILSGSINHYSFETFGVGSNLCTVKGGGTFDPFLNNAQFKMDGPGTIGLVGRHLRPCTARFVIGLDRGLSNLRLPHDTDEKQIFDIDWVVPHQASALALDSLSILGWDKEKILTTISKYGNCIGVSIPLTLIDGIESGRIVRGQKILLVGTSAGISFGGMVITF
jgi:3-oxoacyl-[acyl-carrier-protein] synthase III